MGICVAKRTALTVVHSSIIVDKHRRIHNEIVGLVEWAVLHVG